MSLRMVENGSRTPTEDPAVRMQVPADSSFVRTVRMATQGVAALAGFDVEEHEDLRVGINEVLAALLEAGDGSPLQLSFAVEGSTFWFHGRSPAGPTPVDDQRWELSDRMLAELVDDHHVEVGTVVDVRIAKRKGSW